MVVDRGSNFKALFSEGLVISGLPCKGRLEGASLASLKTWPMFAFLVSHSPFFSLSFVVLCCHQSLL